MKVGYARVSAVDQNLDNQIDALETFGCEKVFKEKLSGKFAENREQLQLALDFVREGDVLVITKLDRMARSVLDLNVIAKLLLDKKVDLKVLTQDIDTTTIYGKLVFNVLGAVAQFERELINERAKEGIVKAKARGVKFGRSKKVNEDLAKSILNELPLWTKSKSDLADKYGISRATLYRLIGSKP
jgi:DNA invertase Pin-like site-specific DNA recombinase